MKVKGIQASAQVQNTIVAEKNGQDRCLDHAVDEESTSLAIREMLGYSSWSGMAIRGSRR